MMQHYSTLGVDQANNQNNPRSLRRRQSLPTHRREPPRDSNGDDAPYSVSDVAFDPIITHNIQGKHAVVHQTPHSFSRVPVQPDGMPYKMPPAYSDRGLTFDANMSISSIDVTDRTSRKRDRHTSRHDMELHGDHKKQARLITEIEITDKAKVSMKKPDKRITSCPKAGFYTLSEDRSGGDRSILLYALKKTNTIHTAKLSESMVPKEETPMSHTGNQPGLVLGGSARLGRVSEQPRQAPSPPAPDSDGQKTLWMGDLEPWIDENFVRSLWFQIMGEHVSVRMIRDKFTGSNARYCHVDFASPQAAVKALSFNGQQKPGCSRPFKLNRARGIDKGVDRRDNRSSDFRMNSQIGLPMSSLESNMRSRPLLPMWYPEYDYSRYDDT